MFVSTAARSTCTGMLWKMILIERATMPLVIELFLVIFKATVASVEIDLYFKQWARMTPGANLSSGSYR